MDPLNEPEIWRVLRGVRKVVINTCHGGFGLSRDAWVVYCMQHGWDPDDRNLHDGMISRDDPDLVAVIESLGQKAHGEFADLKVVQIPQDVNWVIQEYDGREWVAERHRTWR